MVKHATKTAHTQYGTIHVCDDHKLELVLHAKNTLVYVTQAEYLVACGMCLDDAYTRQIIEQLRGY